MSGALSVFANPSCTDKNGHLYPTLLLELPQCQKWPQDWDGKTGLVVLVDIFAHELTFSYSRPWRRVTAYNGTPVLSLEHLRDMWEASCREFKAAKEAGNEDPMFARLGLQSDDDIVLEVKAAMEAEEEVLKRHQIPKASKISPPNPNYI